MRTAREAFLQSNHRADFGKMAETTAMDTATEYALLVYVEETPRESDPNAGWAARCRIEGAREVLAILRSLHIKQERPEPYRPPQLTPPK